MARKILSKSFKISGTSVTIRYKSQTFTSIFLKKEVKNHVLICQFPLENFDTSFFKDCYAALVYMDVNNKMYVGRVGGFAAVVNPENITLNVALVNIQFKEVFDMEHMTPAVFYREILQDKKFFQQTGKSLDLLIHPLGLSRKTRESDQALRRRVISYLESQSDNKSLQEKIQEMIRHDEEEIADE